MRASIYRLRASGVPLPQPQTPVVGDFRLTKEKRGDETMKVARLLGDSKLEALPPLMKADVTVVSEYGMVVHGIEAHSRGGLKSSVRWGPQTWWVFILTEHAIERFESENPLETMADEFRSTSSIGRARKPPG
ncbi:hypothetical protein BN948_01757 [Hydrogenophaga intermedia]|uniref:Uncharacterized protein n=1 Tax=Hydrogenophaga intermedia TaxID=65786 RepID=A0A1L1PK73_HYDIT|nr:hypothetical protein [Hydrogenophaga intermedia]CDN87337.1 hypothetical protein BN948_01757 [Hydrogenophaga intermedia]